MTVLFALLVVALAGTVVAALNGNLPGVIGCSLLVLGAAVGIVSVAAAWRRRSW